MTLLPEGAAPGWSDDDHDDGVFARGLDKHGEVVAVTTRTRRHLMARQHLRAMEAFTPERVIQVIADPGTRDEADPGIGRRRPASRRRFYGPGFDDYVGTVVIVDYDHGIVWTMFGTRSP